MSVKTIVSIVIIIFLASQKINRISVIWYVISADHAVSNECTVITLVMYSKCISITITLRNLQSQFFGSRRCFADGCTTRVVSDLHTIQCPVYRVKKFLTDAKDIVKCRAI